jgi:UDPglucose--hexose-1-phosphate uridylyltransferase
MTAFQFTEHSHRRYNPLTRTWILCSPHRAKRPWQGSVIFNFHFVYVFSPQSVSFYLFICLSLYLPFFLSLTANLFINLTVSGQVEKQVPPVKVEHDPNCYLCPGNKRVGGHLNPSYKSTFIFPNDFPAVRSDQPTYSTTAMLQQISDEVSNSFHLRSLIDLE